MNVNVVCNKLIRKENLYVLQSLFRSLIQLGGTGINFYIHESYFPNQSVLFCLSTFIKILDSFFLNNFYVFIPLPFAVFDIWRTML